jgi:hypothetical protein
MRHYHIIQICVRIPSASERLGRERSYLLAQRCAYFLKGDLSFTPWGLANSPPSSRPSIELAASPQPTSAASSEKISTNLKQSKASYVMELVAP